MNFSSSKLVKTARNEADAAVVPIELSLTTLVLRKKASFARLLYIAVIEE
jgi:hypothetical protein